MVTGNEVLFTTVGLNAVYAAGPEISTLVNFGRRVVSRVVISAWYWKYWKLDKGILEELCIYDEKSKVAKSEGEEF